MEEVYDNRIQRGRICTIDSIEKYTIVTTMTSNEGFEIVTTGKAGTGLVKDSITNAFPIGLPGQSTKEGTFEVTFNRLP